MLLEMQHRIEALELEKQLLRAKNRGFAFVGHLFFEFSYFMMHFIGPIFMTINTQWFRRPSLS